MMQAYEEIVDFIAPGTTPVGVAHFKASPESKAPVADLIERERTSGLSGEETSELDCFMKIEHLMRLAKAHARTFCPNE
jgi:hypothetical protein